ncbi:hypothetical protein [Desulfosporosinus sp. HMP52]|uniref:hypothetical protein n=1 Tax=Desulfosporosinus sp. HMP52 TaxID=1487923 RepID=UPI00068EDB66|nr:hypothetical protein [Desulfosporosinus sp. HMP52]
MKFIKSIQMILNLYQKIPRIKDTTILGLISGTLGVLAMDTFDIIAWLKGKHEMLYGHLSGSMIFHPIRTHRRENFIIGKFMHVITGGALGCLVTWYLQKTGKDHHLIKGSMIGLGSWLILYEFGQNRGWFALKARKSSSFYISILANIIYGATTAQAIVSLADSSVFDRNPNTANKTITNKSIYNTPEPTYSEFEHNVQMYSQ